MPLTMVGSAGDWLLTNDTNEVAVLRSLPSWKEICSAFGAPSSFCADASIAQSGSLDIARGPFTLPSGPSSNSSVPLYRCLDTSTARHSFDGTGACAGMGTIEHVLGFMASSPTSGTARALRRCKTACNGSTGSCYYHLLDATQCASGDSLDAPLLGYVH